MQYIRLIIIIVTIKYWASLPPWTTHTKQTTLKNIKMITKKKNKEREDIEDQVEDQKDQEGDKQDG